jgi:hypothetical protein
MRDDRRDMRDRGPEQREVHEAPRQASDVERKQFGSMLEDLVGTRGAYVLDEKLTILGKVPGSELIPTIRSLNSGIFAVVFDGSIDKDLVMSAEKANVSFLIGTDAKAQGGRTRVLTPEQLA